MLMIVMICQTEAPVFWPCVVTSYLHNSIDGDDDDDYLSAPKHWSAGCLWLCIVTSYLHNSFDDDGDDDDDDMLLTG